MAILSLRRPWLRGTLLGDGQRRPDHSRSRAARAVLSAAAGALGADRAPVRRRLFGARLPALGAGAGALCDAAGAAQYGDRARRRRSALARRRPRPRRERRGTSLRDIELPLALPVIMAGIRTAAVWVIGTATLVDADRPDQPRQLHLRRPADAELGVRALRLRRRRGAGARRRSAAGADGERRRAAQPRARRAGGAGALLALVLAALAPGFAQPRATYVIGAKTFTEQYVLAALIEQRLAAAGLTAARRAGLGSNVLFDALAVERGRRRRRLFRHACGRTTCTAPTCRPREAVLKELGAWLQTDAWHPPARLARLRERLCAGDAAQEGGSARHRIRSPILPRMRRDLTIAGDYEFFARPEWKAMREAYGLHFTEQRTMQPDFMYRPSPTAIVDVISAYSSDGQIAQYDLVVLDDPKHALPPYDAILLVAPQARARRKADRGAQAADRRHRRQDDARSQSARRQRRHHAGRGGDVAVGADQKVRKALTVAETPRIRCHGRARPGHPA